jgi:hypothetical protein
MQPYGIFVNENLPVDRATGRQYIISMGYKDRLVLVFDREKARAALKAQGMTVYQLSLRGGSNRRFQKYFLPGSPAYANINTHTISEIAFAAGLSPLAFLTVLGPAERGGEKPLPAEMEEMPEKRYLRGFNSERGEWEARRLRGRPSRDASAPAQGDPVASPAPTGGGILTAVKGDLEDEVIDPFA